MTAASMFQSRTGSLAEAICNVLAGYVVAVVAQRLIYPLFGIATSLGDDAIALVFTIASLGRSYAIRRLFVLFELQKERERLERDARLAQRLAPRMPS